MKTASAWAAGALASAHTFVDSLDDSCEITGADGHHLERVRRLRAGEFLTAADGTGRWRRYVIERVARGHLWLRAEGPTLEEPELSPRVVVAIAITKASGLDRAVAGLTEIGVTRIEPVRAARCVVQWDAAKAHAAVMRLKTIAKEAAAQSRRARVPEISAVADLATLAGRPGLVVAERSGLPVSRIATPAGGEWTVVVGPEGGFEPGEVESLRPQALLTLGPHVLRADTAPVAAVSLLVGRALAASSDVHPE